MDKNALDRYIRNTNPSALYIDGFDEAIIGSNYYIFYVQVDSNPMCPGLSIDAFNNAPSHRMWTYSSTDGFAEDAPEKKIMVGFGHNAVLGVAPQVIWPLGEPATVVKFQGPGTIILGTNAFRRDGPWSLRS